MAHNYVATLLQSGLTSGLSADLQLESDTGTILQTNNGADIGAENALANPASGFPRIEFFFFSGNNFQHDGNNNWTDPLHLDVDIIDGVATNLEVFSFSEPEFPLTDGDQLTIDDVALQYNNHGGVVAIVDSGGYASTDFRFTLKDGASEISDPSASKLNPVTYSGTQASISIDSNLEFTNNSGSQWTVDGLLCEAKDADGNWAPIDDVSFSSVQVGANATIRFTSVQHSFNYPNI